MVKPAPSRFNPDLLARQSERLGVSFPLASASRLVELLADDSGELSGTFEVTRRGKRLSAKGHFDTVFTLTCQRCLSTFAHPVSADFDFVLVTGQAEADKLPETLDPVLLAEDGMLHVVDMLEDELILHIPAVPKHTEVEDCTFAVEVDLQTAAQAAAQAATGAGQTAERTDVQSGKETFAALKNLRFD